MQVKIHEYQVLGSTNDELYNLAKNGAQNGTVVSAREQTCGRGTKGRAFFSPSASGIYMSVLLRDVTASDVGFVTALTAVIVSDAIDEICDTSTKIKWVNDVYLGGKKVCGILTKGEFSGGNCDFVVVGIGINFSKPQGDFPQELNNIATHICDVPNEMKRILLIKTIAKRLVLAFENSLDREFIQVYRDKSLLIGKQVTVNFADTCFRANVVGIDDNCHLIIQKDDGEMLSLSSGEVSIRDF